MGFSLFGLWFWNVNLVVWLFSVSYGGEEEEKEEEELVCGGVCFWSGVGFGLNWVEFGFFWI